MAQRTGINRTAIDSVEELQKIIAQYCLGDETPRPDILVSQFLKLIHSKLKKATSNNVTLNTLLGPPEQPEKVSVASILGQFEEYFTDKYHLPKELAGKEIEIQKVANQLKLNANSVAAADDLLIELMGLLQPTASTGPAEEVVVPPEMDIRIRLAFTKLEAEKTVANQLSTAYAEVLELCSPGSGHNASRELHLPPDVHDEESALASIINRMRGRPQTELDAAQRQVLAEAKAKVEETKARVEATLSLSLTQAVDAKPPFLPTLQNAINDIPVLGESIDRSVNFTRPDDLNDQNRPQVIVIVINRLVGNVVQNHPAEVHLDPTDEQLLGFAQESLTAFSEATGPVIAAHKKLIAELIQKAQDNIDGKTPETETATEAGGGETAADNATVPQLTPEEEAAQKAAEEEGGLGERKKQLMKLHELQEKLTNVAEGALVDELIGQGFTKEQAETIAKEHRTELAQQLWARLLSEGAEGDLKFSRAVLVMDGVVQEARQLLVAQRTDITLQGISPITDERQEKLAKLLAGDQDSIEISLHQLESNEYANLLATEKEATAQQLIGVLGKLGIDASQYTESQIQEIIVALRGAGDGEFFSQKSLSALLTGLGDRDQVTLRALQRVWQKNNNLNEKQRQALQNLIDHLSDKGLIAALWDNPLNNVARSTTTLSDEEVNDALAQLLSVANGEDFLHIAQRAQQIVGEHSQKEAFLADALLSGQWWQQLSPEDKAALLEKLRFNPHTSALLLSGNYQSRRAPTAAVPVIGQPAVGTMKFIQELRTDPRTQASFAFLMQVMNDEAAPPAVVANFSTHMYLLQEGYISYDTFVIMVQSMLEDTAAQTTTPDGQPLDWNDSADQTTIIQQSSEANAKQRAKYLQQIQDQQSERRAMMKVAKVLLTTGPAGLPALLLDKDVRKVLIKNVKRMALGFLIANLPALTIIGGVLTLLGIPQQILSALGVGGSATSSMAGATSAMGTMAGQVASGGLQGGAAIAANAAPTVQAATSMGTHALTSAANNTLAAAQTALQTGMTQAASMTMTIPLVSGIFIGGLATLATLTIIVITVIGGSLNDLPMGTGASLGLLPPGDTGCITLDQNSFLSAQSAGVSPTAALTKLVGEATKLMQSPLARGICSKLGNEKITIVYDSLNECGNGAWGCVYHPMQINVTSEWIKGGESIGVFLFAHESGHILQQKTNFAAAYIQAVGPKEIPTYPICSGYQASEWEAEALGLTIYTSIYSNSNNPYVAKASCSSWYTQTINNYNIRIEAPNVVQFIEGFLR